MCPSASRVTAFPCTAERTVPLASASNVSILANSRRTGGRVNVQSILTIRKAMGCVRTAIQLSKDALTVPLRKHASFAILRTR